MLLLTLAVLVHQWLKPDLQKMLSAIEKKMEQNQDGRQSSLGLLETMTALQTKLHDVTLVCDDSLTI